MFFQDIHMLAFSADASNVDTTFESVKAGMVETTPAGKMLQITSIVPIPNGDGDIDFYVTYQYIPSQVINS